MTPIIVAAVASLVISAIAAVTDTRTGLIPNWLTYPPMVIAPLAHALWGGWSAVGASLLAIVLCGFMPYLLFRMGGMGGGDVKLFAALGAILGPRLGLQVEFYALLAGALISILMLAKQKRLGTLFRNTYQVAANMVRPASRRKEIKSDARDVLRLGAAIFVGNLWVVGIHAYQLRDAI